MINPTDPVSLGLCSQIDLDALVHKAMAKKTKADEEAQKGLEDGQALQPVGAQAPIEAEPKKSEPTLESLFKPSNE